MTGRVVFALLGRWARCSAGRPGGLGHSSPHGGVNDVPPPEGRAGRSRCLLGLRHVLGYEMCLCVSVRSVWHPPENELWGGWH